MTDGPTKTIWLHLLKKGGRWSINELRSAMTGLSSKSVEVSVTRMAVGGFLKRFEKQAQGDLITYGVTRDCKVPNGVPLEELIEIGILREAA